MKKLDDLCKSAAEKKKVVLWIPGVGFAEVTDPSEKGG